jgi:hypothetical protein
MLTVLTLRPTVSAIVMPVVPIQSREPADAIPLVLPSRELR